MASEQTGTEPPAVDPAEFARTIGETPDEQLAAGMRGEARLLVLDGIFDAMAEHFRPERAQGVEAVIDWKILDRPEGGYDHYRVTIKNGTCTVGKGGDGPARVTFRLGPVDFLKLATGNANGAQLFLTGRLKIDGDVMFAARVQALFRLPEASAGSQPAGPAQAI